MKALDDNYIFGLDIGTRSIVGIVGYEKADGFHVVRSYSELHQSRTMLNGQIHDIDEVAKTIRNVKKKLETELDAKLSKVCIAAAGRVLKTVKTTVSLKQDEAKEIKKEDVLSLELLGREKALDLVNQENSRTNTKFYCVGDTVTNYYLNDFLMKSLVGHKGGQIKADVLSTFLPKEVVDSLYKVIELAGLTVYSLTLEPIAAIEVAIPEKFRLLNIALVDIGAGTSDIVITKGGSIIAYGMIPYAGDEITENLAHKFLVDFATAEEMKLAACNGQAEIVYTDIIGIEHRISQEDVLEEMKEQVNKMAGLIRDKIIELNHDTPTNAVFIVGGGGKVTGFADKLSKKMKLDPARVVIRGQEVLEFVSSEQDFCRCPENVTPVGICLVGAHNNRKDFVQVFLNDEVVKIYNNHNLTVLDIVAFKGISAKSFIPERGEEIKYKLNDAKCTLKGGIGKEAAIYINEVAGNLASPVKEGDYIVIEPAVKGETARCYLKDVAGSQITVDINNETKVVKTQVYVNDAIQESEYILKDGDVIVCQHPTLSDIGKLFSIQADKFFVNGMEADPDTVIHSNDAINWFKSSKVERENKPPEADKIIEVTVNQQPITLTGKHRYVFVDIFDFYEFDIKNHQGKLRTLKNGKSVAYLEPIHGGDQLEIFWE